jgi:Fe2+ or Zn2+ uptake regulation protein
VRRVATPGGVALYDSRVEDHGHLVCRHCGRVEDVDARADPGPALAAARRAGFAAERAETAVIGLCRDCRA